MIIYADLASKPLNSMAHWDLPHFFFWDDPKRYCYFPFEPRNKINTTLELIYQNNSINIIFPELPTAKRITWQINASNEQSLGIPFDGVPFIFIGKEVKICHHGADKNISKKKKLKAEKESSVRNISLVCNFICWNQSYLIMIINGDHLYLKSEEEKFYNFYNWIYLNLP